MSDLAVLEQNEGASTSARAGECAADLIWRNDPMVPGIVDPRDQAFANAVIDRLSHALATTPGVLQQLMSGAASAAEDLNVEPFQGLIEVIQNGDDLGASEVRFALRERESGTQLLIVHNGRPVVCQHVLAMTLPYLTTKKNDPTQKGRFGIGLKTLARISTRLRVHGHPYHFAAERLTLHREAEEGPIRDFYDPSTDTLLVLDLSPEFDEDELRGWFESWDQDGLIFLSSVHSFRWVDLDGTTRAHKAVTATRWEEPSFGLRHEELRNLRQRVVSGGYANWQVFTANATVPTKLQRAHKATGETASISIAIPSIATDTGVYIAFKTRVPSHLAFSLDAQFDPSTAREELIENSWNAWLIERLADLLIDVAIGLLAQSPRNAWTIIPLKDERVGNETTRWPREAFGTAFERVRGEIGAAGRIRCGADYVSLAQIAYEDVPLHDLLTLQDIELLAPNHRALSPDARDPTGRWRNVLDQIAVCTIVGTSRLLEGFSDGIFTDKSPAWWVNAADRITLNHAPAGVFGVPFWLTQDGRAVSAHPDGQTQRPLVFSPSISNFASKWGLLDQLHDAYAEGDAGRRVLDWLAHRAAFTTVPDPATELAAFATLHCSAPLQVSDENLREIRDRFDLLSDRRAQEVGHRVGAALLVETFSFKAGRKVPEKISPLQAYLPRTLDNEHPDWPEAAGMLPGISWIAARYSDVLKTMATRRVRKRADGTISRGPRKFLMLLGAACAPRLEERGRTYAGGALRRRELRERGAESVASDYVSPDMERVLESLPKLPKKQRRIVSAALLRVLSRYWDDMYAARVHVEAQHEARVYIYDKGKVLAAWICKLRETPWVAVGKGDLQLPENAAIRNGQTESLYSQQDFVSEIAETDVSMEVASALRLITDVRVSDLVAHLSELRKARRKSDYEHILRVYRTLARLCPKGLASAVGDLSADEFRRRFAEGDGLVCVSSGVWRRPDRLFSGQDVFHEPERFVPSGSIYAELWRVLRIDAPTLPDCIRELRRVADLKRPAESEAILIDVYRYMETLLADADRRYRERVRALPMNCSGRWVSERPIFLVDDREMRSALATVLSENHFWTPPCDISDLPVLVAWLGLAIVRPVVAVNANRELALQAGEALVPAFRRSVDQLSNELARNDAAARDSLAITWDQLRDIPLFVHDAPFEVVVHAPELKSTRIRVPMKALVCDKPRELHAWDEALPQRDHCGRAIASLFPLHARWKIENAWVTSWIASQELPAVKGMRFASDEEHSEALSQLAQEIDSADQPRVKVTPPRSRSTNAQTRVLKSFHGAIERVEVRSGLPAGPIRPSVTKPLLPNPPSSGPPAGSPPPVAPVEYSIVDLEQRGWEVLTHVLKTNGAEELIDFRKRHGVGADGVIDWKKFVELKATGRTLQPSIEMSNAEFDRARERGLNFILALVSGLEQGYSTEVRLILDPANRATIKPIHGIKLVRLSEAPAIIVRLADEDEENSSSG